MKIGKSSENLDLGLIVVWCKSFIFKACFWLLGKLGFLVTGFEGYAII